MPITLNDYLKQAKTKGDYISQAIIEDLVRDSETMSELSFTSISSLKAKGVRWQTLPSAAFRQVGAGYTEGTGRVEEIEETISILGGDILADRVFEHVKDTLEDPVTTQMKLKAKAVARTFNDYLTSCRN